MIVSRDAPTTVVDDGFEEDDVRAMSPRRSSQEVDRLGEANERECSEWRLVNANKRRKEVA